VGVLCTWVKTFNRYSALPDPLAVIRGRGGKGLEMVRMKIRTEGREGAEKDGKGRNGKGREAAE